MSKFKEYLSNDLRYDLIGLPFFIGAVAILVLGSPIIWLACFICMFLLSFICGIIFSFEPYISYIAWISVSICAVVYLVAFSFLAYVIFSRKL